MKTNKSKVINDVDDNAETIQYEYQSIIEEQDNEDDDEDIIDDQNYIKKKNLIHWIIIRSMMLKNIMMIA